MTRRVLFVLRGKLGETVVAFATVRAFADAYPGDDVTLLVRANYAPLFEREAGMRVIGFSSRIAMFAKLLRLRWFEAPFDALLVLLGAGPPIERLGRMVRARRKIFLDGRFKDVYTEWPQVPGDHRHFEPAWLVARSLRARAGCAAVFAHSEPRRAAAPREHRRHRAGVGRAAAQHGPRDASRADRGARALASRMRDPGARQSRRQRRAAAA